MESHRDPSSSSPQRPGRWRRRFLALALGLGLPLLAGEFAARAILGVPLKERLPIVEVQANALRGWEMVPNQLHYTYLNPVKINALGLRGEELSPKKEGLRRVLALGDSLIYGQGVADDETVPAYLEDILNDSKGGSGEQTPIAWDVVNAGHRAYDTGQELGLLKELGGAIEPDVVIVFWFWNDVHERDIAGTFERLSASGPIFFDTGNHLEGLDLWVWKGKELLRRSALLMTLWDLLNAKQTQPNDEAYIDSAFERLDNYLMNFQAQARTMGFSLWFAPIPDPGSLLGEHPSDAFLDRAMERAREQDLRVIDLRPGLEALAQGQGAAPVIPYDGHYLPAANAVIAAQVAEALERGDSGKQNRE